MKIKWKFEAAPFTVDYLWWSSVIKFQWPRQQDQRVSIPGRRDKANENCINYANGSSAYGSAWKSAKWIFQQKKKNRWLEPLCLIKSIHCAAHTKSWKNSQTEIGEQINQQGPLIVGGHERGERQRIKVSPSFDSFWGPPTVRVLLVAFLFQNVEHQLPNEVLK